MNARSKRWLGRLPSRSDAAMVTCHDAGSLEKEMGKMNRKLVGLVTFAVVAALAGAVVTTYKTRITNPVPLSVGDGKNGPADMVWIPGANFLMGTDNRMTLPNERPAHEVHVSG